MVAFMKGSECIVQDPSKKAKEFLPARQVVAHVIAHCVEIAAFVKASAPYHGIGQKWIKDEALLVVGEEHILVGGQPPPKKFLYEMLQTLVGEAFDTRRAIRNGRVVFSKTKVRPNVPGSPSPLSDSPAL